MHRPYVFAALLILAVPSTALAYLTTSYSGLTTAPPGYVMTDFYVDTRGAEWLNSRFYCELESGTLYQDPATASTPWVRIPGSNDEDSWLAPYVSVLNNADELAVLPPLSGDPANAAASITMLAMLPDDPIPPWDGLAMRTVFSPDAQGVYVFTVSVRGSDPVVFTGSIWDGYAGFFPLEDIPGDLDGDRYVGSADLDIVRENWNSSVPPGDLLQGDPSGDGFVGSADLDIVRANWGTGYTAVPEPAFAWVGLAFASCFLRHRRKRNSSCAD